MVPSTIVTILSCEVVFHLGVSKNRGTPEWMIYNGNPKKKNGWFGGKTHYFWKHPLPSFWKKGVHHSGFFSPLDIHLWHLRRRFCYIWRFPQLVVFLLLRKKNRWTCARTTHPADSRNNTNTWCFYVLMGTYEMKWIEANDAFLKLILMVFLWLRLQWRVFKSMFTTHATTHVTWHSVINACLWGARFDFPV